jgi:TonB family protein
MFKTCIASRANVHALYASLVIHMALLGTLWHSPIAPARERGIRIVHASELPPMILPVSAVAATTPPVRVRYDSTAERNKNSLPARLPDKPLATPVEIPSDIAALAESTQQPSLLQGFPEARLQTAAGSFLESRALHPAIAAPPEANWAEDSADHTSPAPPPPPLRIGGRVELARIVKRIPPIYPPLARAARVEGTVVIDAVIATSGRLENMKVLRGHPLLVSAALDCVRQWRYQPARLNGKLIESPAHIEVNFELKWH